MNSLIIIQTIIFLGLFIVGILLIRLSNSLKKEERISRYTIDPIKHRDDSFFDRINNDYKALVKLISNGLKKYSLFNKISKKYEKYILIGDDVCLLDFIAKKIIIGLGFLFIVIFSYAIQFKSIGLFYIIFFFIIGYYIYDIYLIYNRRVKIKKIRNDMLRAVMIMNNAFKSGKSTIQAVYIASCELSYPINHEFWKIYQDMKYGLSVEVVFERFAKRVNVEEASYVASSLTILNKTGGNIIAVFNSIEKTLFDKKKLEEELKNLTGASNLVVKILLVVPIVFILFIYVLNPSYFDPLFESVLGYMVIVVLIIMFSIYVWLLNKIMKVRI